MKNTILIADTDEICRDALKSALGRTHPLIVVESNPAALTALKGKQEVRTVFLGLEGAKKSDMSLISAMRTLRPTCKIIVMTPHNKEAAGLKAVEHGASGYVIKPLAGHEILSLADN